MKFCVDSENLIYFNMKIDLYVKILIFYVKNDFLMIFYDFYDVFDDFNDFLSILNRLKTQKFIWIWKIWFILMYKSIYILNNWCFYVKNIF